MRCCFPAILRSPLLPLYTPPSLHTKPPEFLRKSHFIPFDFRSAANAGSKQTASLIAAVSSCLSSCDRRRPGQQRGLAEHGGRRRPGKREETQQEARDLPEGGHQHHEGMALPAPNSESLYHMCSHRLLRTQCRCVFTHFVLR